MRKVGIYQGSLPERVHFALEFQENANCGIRSHGRTNAFWREWLGTTHEVDCKRCLVIERAKLRKKMELVEHRLVGRKGIQRDAFEGIKH